MPVQKFAPMKKEFPSFDCDAHVTEPPWLWERAKDYLTKDEFQALRGSFSFDVESRRLIANGLGYANPASLFHGSAGMVNVLSLAGASVMTSSAPCTCVMCTAGTRSPKNRPITSITRAPICRSPACAIWIFKGSTKC